VHLRGYSYNAESGLTVPRLLKPPAAFGLADRQNCQ